MSLRSPVGELFVAATETGVVATSFNQRSFLEDLATMGRAALFHGASEDATHLARAARDQLGRYFEETLRRFDVTLTLGASSEFAQAVLAEVAHHLPFGETATYGEIGERAGRTRAARAVGNILASCPFSVLVPCHRVVHAAATDQEKFPGEADHSSRKAWLLRFEQRVVAGG